MRLAGGGVLHGLRVERAGGLVTVVSASGRVSVPEARVLSVTNVPPAAPSRLNVVGSDGGDGGAAPHDESAAARTGREGDAWSRVPELVPLVLGQDWAAAEAEARRCALARPGDPAVAIAAGEILLARSRHAEAVTALRAVATSGLAAPLRRARDLALAEALSRLNRGDEALSLLRQTPDDGAGRVAATRARLEPDRELLQRPLASSAHFSLIGTPGTSRAALDALLAQMEEMHSMLSRQLGGAPRDRISVVLHPGTEFWEATGMGSEVGALYDGRMRLPAGSIDPPSRSLAATLRHEMTHAFVEALSGGRADTRWHEGVAEHFEGSDAAPTTRELTARARNPGANWPPPVTHATSHARLEWFLGRWGMAGLRQVLAGMASQGTIDRAVRSVTGLGESELDEAWRRDLAGEAR